MKNTSYVIMVIALIAALFVSIAYAGSISMLLAITIVGAVFLLVVGIVIGMALKQI